MRRHTRQLAINANLGKGVPCVKQLRFLDPLVNLVYPPRCPLCGAGIEAQSGLCAACWSDLTIPGEPCCTTCQRPFRDGNTREKVICAPCLQTPPRHAGISAGTLYTDASRKLALAFKHGGKIAYAPMMARLIVARLPETIEQPIIVPVPLHRWRLWKRGYNQAALLARQVGKLTGHECKIDALIRTRPTPSLGGLGKKDRAKALRGAISVSPSSRAVVKGRHIIVVDDVLTSGATSDACVRVLLTAGATTVRIACFARVLDDAGAPQRLNETPGVEMTPGAA